MTTLARECYEEQLSADIVYANAHMSGGDAHLRIIGRLQQLPGLLYGEVLRCAFCDEAYEGTKPIPREILEAHIRICEKHPLTQELVFTRDLLVRASKREWDHHVEMDLRQINLPTNRDE